MSTKIFVGNLSWNTDNDALYNHFQPYGQIQEASIIVDRQTGKSRGFAFITYADPDAAQRAVHATDGQQLDGRSLRVNLANDRPPRGGGGGGGGGYGGGGYNRSGQGGGYGAGGYGGGFVPQGGYAGAHAGGYQAYGQAPPPQGGYGGAGGNAPGGSPWGHGEF